MQKTKNWQWLFYGIASTVVWSGITLMLALDGQWMDPVASEGNTNEFYAWVKHEALQRNKGNTALVLIEHGEVVRELFINEGDTASSALNEDTLFPTASFSKWVTALGIMSLVEQRKIDLDAPISKYLTRWSLPDSKFNNEAVTVRKLLSHTAGLTDGLGFGDYVAGEELPTLEESLQHPRASDESGNEIVVGITPGTEFKYSGGGYLILQLLVEEVTGETFADHIQSSILGPAQMTRSTYAYLGNLENASASYKQDGSLAPSYLYASPAATGFSSSTRDLTRLIQHLSIDGVDGVDGAVLTHATTTQMRVPHGFSLGAAIWGLGTILYAPTPDGDYVYGHDGANNPAINSSIRINPDSSDAIVVLVSGHPTLASNIGAEWVFWQTGKPDFLSIGIAVKSAWFPMLSGNLLVVFMFFVLAWKQNH